MPAAILRPLRQLKLAARRLVMPDYELVSFPKSGRTWLRMMIGTALATELRLETDDPTDLTLLRRLNPVVPRIAVTHGGDAYLRPAAEIAFERRLYRHKHVVLLVRDPRDIIVSMHFQSLYRRFYESADLPRFESVDAVIASERAGLASIMRFYNVWAEHRHEVRGFLLVTYEDLKAEPRRELERCLKFMRLRCSAASVDAALKAGSFENMRSIESSGTGPARLQAGDLSNPDSFKTRRGLVGGHVDYLSSATIEAMDGQIAKTLSPYFGRYII